MKTDIHIEIVSSSHSRLWLSGQQTRDNLVASLRLYFNQVRLTMLDSSADLTALINRRPDVVFLGMTTLSGSLGPKLSRVIGIADVLDAHNIPYTGSENSARLRALNKASAKRVISDAHLRTPNFFVSRNGCVTEDQLHRVKYPMFVKPVDRGGGVGIDNQSIVHNSQQLVEKVRSIHTLYQAESIIESYLTGREFSVSILKNLSTGQNMALPIEICAPVSQTGDRILSREIKKADIEQTTLVKDSSTHKLVSNFALQTFEALGARDYGRIDIRLDESGSPSFLEANLNPGLKLSSGAYFPKACRINLGLDYPQMIACIVELARLRIPAQSVLQSI